MEAVSLRTHRPGRIPARRGSLRSVVVLLVVVVLCAVVATTGPALVGARTAAADDYPDTLTCTPAECSGGIALLLWAILWALSHGYNQATPPPVAPVVVPGTVTPALPWRPFASTSAWNTPIAANTLTDADSAAIVAALTTDPSKIAADLYEYGTPVYEADASTPRVKVTCTMNWGDCFLTHQLVPIPDNAAAASGSDGHLVVVDRTSGYSYELWQARKINTTTWSASWGAVLPLDGDGRSTPVTNNAVGAGISRLAGLVRVNEIRNGDIPHALVFSSAKACRGSYRYPATKTDGNSSAANCIPEGARIQLDPSIDVDSIAGITPGERTIAKALQTYGAYVGDTGGANMAFPFEVPTSEDGTNPYPAAGLAWDYHNMAHIPWNRIRVLGSGTGPDLFPTA